jgi:L-lysine 6-oxidase
MQFSIHPSVGVARLGNSPNQICLSPTTIGGLPYDADKQGNAIGPISTFKDPAGLIKRQGQPFRLFQDNGNELTLDSPNVVSIEWTVHLANKKAAWYQYKELQGNLLYGDANSYTNLNVPLRNADITDRQSLIFDPGPRTITGRHQAVPFTQDTAPLGYPVRYPPSLPIGQHVTTLGDLRTDKLGRLVVLGGYGNAGGNKTLDSYGGADSWYDDISDGPVYCTVTFKDGSPAVSLSAWVVVGSPDFAPEIVNISSLSDTMFDVGVRAFSLVPDIYDNGNWNVNYQANFQRDILPIIQRIGRYQWVANVQPMMAFASNVFDFSDNSDANAANRQNYFAYFRHGAGKFPMMPLNSGSNSVSNVNVMKFMALDATQLFLLRQWAAGKFVSTPDYKPYPVFPLDAASVGNCVGLPMCPGIEVTWNMQNPAVYAAPYVIRQFGDEALYLKQGLTPNRDECEGGGCEPGDLTKRMACPWQADFFQCTFQYINFTIPEVNKITVTKREPDGTLSPLRMPLPPTYFTYWWPPQSPWDVLVGEFTDEKQAQTHVPAGKQVNYARGINSFVQMVQHWSALGFVRNLNGGDSGFPYIVETERNNELFSYKEVGIGDITGNPLDNEASIPVFYLEPDKNQVKARSAKAQLLVDSLENNAFKDMDSEINKEPIKELPRSGTRIRS